MKYSGDANAAMDIKALLKKLDIDAGFDDAALLSLLEQKQMEYLVRMDNVTDAQRKKELEDMLAEIEHAIDELRHSADRYRSGLLRDEKQDGKKETSDADGDNFDDLKGRGRDGKPVSGSAKASGNKGTGGSSGTVRSSAQRSSASAAASASVSAVPAQKQIVPAQPPGSVSSVQQAAARSGANARVRMHRALCIALFIQLIVIIWKALACGVSIWFPMMLWCVLALPAARVAWMFGGILEPGISRLLMLYPSSQYVFCLSFYVAQASCFSGATRRGMMFVLFLVMLGEYALCLLVAKIAVPAATKRKRPVSGKQKNRQPVVLLVVLLAATLAENLWINYGFDPHRAALEASESKQGKNIIEAGEYAFPSKYWFGIHEPMPEIRPFDDWSDIVTAYLYSRSVSYLTAPSVNMVANGIYDYISDAYACSDVMTGLEFSEPEYSENGRLLSVSCEIGYDFENLTTTVTEKMSFGYEYDMSNDRWMLRNYSSRGYPAIQVMNSSETLSLDEPKQD